MPPGEAAERAARRMPTGLAGADADVAAVVGAAVPKVGAEGKARIKIPILARIPGRIDVRVLIRDPGRRQPRSTSRRIR